MRQKGDSLADDRNRMCPSRCILILFSLMPGCTCQATPDANQLAASGRPAATYQSLSEVLAAAASAPQAELTFPEYAQAATAGVNIAADLRLSGQSSTLSIAGIVRVGEHSRLLMRNFTLVGDGDQGEIVSAGELIFETVTIRGWKNHVVSIVGGEMSIADSTIEGNKGRVFCLERWSSAEVKGVNFLNNSGGFVTVGASNAALQGLFIANSTFLGNAVTPIIQLTEEVWGAMPLLTIDNCTFGGNSAVLLDLWAVNASWTVRSSTFFRNTNSGIRASQCSFSALISNCTWRNNSNSLLLLFEFSGTLIVADSEVLQQTAAPAFSVVNLYSTEACTVGFAASGFNQSDAEAINVVRCAVLIQQCAFQGFNGLQRPSSEQYCVVVAKKGSLVIEDSEFVNVVGTFSVVYVQMSSVWMRNILFTASNVNWKTLLIAVGSTASLRDILLTDSLSISGVYIQSGTPRTVYIVAEMSHISASNLTVRSSTFVGALLGAMFSNVELSSITLQKTNAFSVFYTRSSIVKVKTATCELCSLTHFLEGVTSEIEVAHVEFWNSTISSSLFLSIIRGTLTLSSVTGVSTVFEGLVVSESSALIVSGLTLQNCTFDVLLLYFITSQATISNTHCNGVSGGLFTGKDGAVNISDSAFQVESSLWPLFLSLSSHVYLRNVSVTGNWHSVFARGQHGSLSLLQVAIDAQAVRGQLILSQAMNITIDQSQVAHINSASIQVTGASVTLQSSNFSAGGVAASGLLICMDCLDVRISQTRILGFSATLGGAVYCEVTEGISSRVRIDRSHFGDCSASDGGALWLKNVSVEITHSSFSNCVAESRGGAVFLRNAQPCTISSTDFTGNSASEGGAIKWVGSLPTTSQLTFQNNSADYGPDVASFVVRLEQSSDNSIPPGQNVTVEFELRDHYSQLVTTSTAQFLSLQSSPELEILGINSKPVIDGKVSYTGVSLLATPNSTQALAVQYVIDSLDFSNIFESQVNMTFRDCVAGEIRLNKSCTTCAAGYYSFSSADKECTLCPPGADCPGGAVIFPKAGAWATNNIDWPVALCPVESLCQGTTENICAEGHCGRVCGECESGRAPLVAWSCWQCPAVPLLFLEPAVALLFLVGAFHAVLSFSQSLAHKERLHALKVLIGHMQFLSLLSFLAIERPAAMDVFLHSVLALSTASVASLPMQCLGVEYVSARLIGAAAAFLLFGVAALTATCRAALRRRWGLYRQELSTLSLFVSWQLPVISAICLLPLFSCDDRVDGVARLTGSMETQCWDTEHLHQIHTKILPISAFAIIFPTLHLLYTLRKRANALRWEYRCGCWELLWLAAKITTCSAILLPQGVRTACTLFLALLALYTLCLVNGLAPLYHTARALFLSQASCFVLAASYSLHLAYLDYHYAAIQYSVIVANIVFLSICGLLAAKRQQRAAVYIVPRDSVQVRPPTNSLLEAVQLNVSHSSSL